LLLLSRIQRAGQLSVLSWKWGALCNNIIILLIHDEAQKVVIALFKWSLGLGHPESAGEQVREHPHPSRNAVKLLVSKGPVNSTVSRGQAEVCPDSPRGVAVRYANSAQPLGPASLPPPPKNI
jgi:hypothetical protein